MAFLEWSSEPKTRNREIAATASRLANMGLSLPDSIVSDGRLWYRNINRVATEDARSVGLTASQGAGIIAAVSPNLEFENRNSSAITQLANLDESDWDLVRRSAVRRTPENRMMPRLPEVTEMLQDKAPDIVASYDLGLLKANRIMQGEQWRNVLKPYKGPKGFYGKTGKFAGNIENPEEETGVTVDYRHNDIIANRMLPPKYKRGLDAASRYNTIEDITRLAAQSASRRDPRFENILPHDLQAVLWVGGKWIESKGGVRGVGVERVGQKYTTAEGRPLHRDSAFWRV